MKAKKILIIIFFLGPLACLSQEGKLFTIHGKIPDSKLDSVSLLYINDQGKVNRETLPISNGSFEITGKISQPTMAYLLFLHKGEKLSKKEIEAKTNKIFVEPGQMTINSEADVDGFMQVSGSKSHAEWNELKSQTKAVQSTIDSISQRGVDHGMFNGNREKLASLKRKLAQISYDYFMHHPSSYVTANQVMFFTSLFSLDSLKLLYNNYTPEIKESFDGRRLIAEIKTRTTGFPGTMALQFTVKDKNGRDLSLADFKGKYVLLDFWATWCVPCRESMPHMIGLYEKYKDKNFDIIAIGDDDTRVKEWADAIEHDGIGMFHHTLRGVNAELVRKGLPNPRDLDEGFGIRSLPTLILVNPNGEIIGRFSENKEQLDQMLADIFR